MCPNQLHEEKKNVHVYVHTKCFQVVTFYEEEGEIRFNATGKKRPKFLF